MVLEVTGSALPPTVVKNIGDKVSRTPWGLHLLHWILLHIRYSSKRFFCPGFSTTRGLCISLSFHTYLRLVKLHAPPHGDKRAWHLAWPSPLVRWSAVSSYAA